VPIRGEAGVGYVLEAGLDLPPLMLTQDEIDAAVLGAQRVARHSDPILARAAEDLIAKIGAVVPERLRPYVLEPVTAGARPRRRWSRHGAGACPDPRGPENSVMLPRRAGS
jgi:predicted DNA-binding transcriptional regulator YafY